MERRKFILFLLFGPVLFGQGQQANLWKNKQAAVVLTYDDALNVHLDNAIPLLDSLKLRGTFYLTAASGAFTKRLNDWKKAAQKNHELANHTLFHPCDGKLAGRSFVSADYDLSTYTLRRIHDEMKLTNTMLEALDGKMKRTFAYPCGDTRIGDSLYIEGVKTEFVGARGVKSEMIRKGKVDLYNIGCYSINGQSGEELIELVKKAIAAKSLIVFLFHGVGGEHSLNVSLEAHRKLLVFLKQQQQQIWNATFLEVVEYLKVQPAS